MFSVHCVRPALFVGHEHQSHINMVGLVFTSGEDSRIHESGHAEVSKGEEEDHGIVDGNERGKILRQPRAPAQFKKKGWTKQFQILIP